MSPTSEAKAEDDLEVIELEHQMCFPLYAASRLVVQAYRSHLEALGLTYPLSDCAPPGYAVIRADTVRAR